MSNSGHYACVADDGDGIPAPSLQSRDVILEAWHEVLGQVLHERDNEWKRKHPVKTAYRSLSAQAA